VQDVRVTSFLGQRKYHARMEDIKSQNIISGTEEVSCKVEDIKTQNERKK
jgi:hypothetical protein